MRKGKSNQEWFCLLFISLHRFLQKHQQLRYCNRLKVVTTIGQELASRFVLYIYCLSMNIFFSLISCRLVSTSNQGFLQKLLLGHYHYSVSQPTMQLSTAPYQSNMPSNHMNEEATLSIAVTQPVIPKTKQSFNNKGKVSI